MPVATTAAPAGKPVSPIKAEMRAQSRRFASSRRFTRDGWGLDVYIDFLGLAAATKLTAEVEEERSGNDDQITNMATTAALLPPPLLLSAIKSILLHAAMIRFWSAI
jgi:hypothetical protein